MLIPEPAPSTDENQLEVYAVVGSTAVLLWDIILHIPEDYKQIQRQGFWKISRLVYCFSRLTTLFYMIGRCITFTAPLGNCTFVRYLSYTYPLTTPFSILLFLFRVYALFRNRGYVLVICFLSWLLVLGSSIAFGILVEARNVDGTKFCTSLRTNERNAANAAETFIRFFHDTLVFIATSCWLYRSDLADRRNSFRSIVFGKHLLPLTRSLLHDGQAYYLATLVLNILAFVLLLVPKPFVTPCTVGDPLFVLISNLACHVYRNLINARYRDHSEFLQWQDGEWREESKETLRFQANSEVKRMPSGDSSV